MCVVLSLHFDVLNLDFAILKLKRCSKAATAKGSFRAGVKTALLQGISLFKDPTCFLTCPLFTLAAALTMQTAPNKRFFPQFLTTKRSAANASDVDELSLVELLEAEDNPGPLQNAHPSSAKRAVPGAQAYVNRLLVRVNEAAQKKHIRLTSGLTSHSFRGGAVMHANDGSLAEHWIIERGGWQLDRVNNAFGYMVGTTQADQRVTRILSGWSPKQDARLPSLHALDPQIRDRARTFQALLFAGTLGFADTALNLDETRSECLAATLIMHCCGVAERTNIVRCGYPPKPQQPPSRVGACFGLRRGWSPRGSALLGQWVSRLGRHRLTKSATPEPSRASWLRLTNNPVSSTKGWAAAR
ncbi:unnamed protein product [Phytophthora fragariaefolia]|uniref:Unnamed protein product n=1 Tax=Phytophthora fragariaefolia TaxID=1490495 RepID=A0A9W6X4U2_9STRA|nr:unnamed protein product [Phytophthora fragariaefolia]